MSSTRTATAKRFRRPAGSMNGVQFVHRVGSALGLGLREFSPERAWMAGSTGYIGGSSGGASGLAPPLVSSLRCMVRATVFADRSSPAVLPRCSVKLGVYCGADMVASNTGSRVRRRRSASTSSALCSSLATACRQRWRARRLGVDHGDVLWIEFVHCARYQTLYGQTHGGGESMIPEFQDHSGWPHDPVPSRWNLGEWPDERARFHALMLEWCARVRFERALIVDFVVEIAGGQLVLSNSSKPRRPLWGAPWEASQGARPPVIGRDENDLPSGESWKRIFFKVRR